MHELSIAQNIVTMVVDYLERHHPNCRSASKVGVRLGAMTDLCHDSLSFGYEMSCRGTVLEGSKIEIETVPVTVHCGDCGRQSNIENLLFRCAHCKGGNVEPKTGMELDLAWIQLEDEQSNHEQKKMIVEPSAQEQT